MICLLPSSALVLALSVAASTQTVDAFTNLDPAPNVYGTGGNGTYSINAAQTQGFQFTATGAGVLSGFKAALNNASPGEGLLGLSLELYADSGADRLGTLLGSYGGVSTGSYFAGATSTLASVAATGTPVPIVTGAKYWLVAASGNALGWNSANSSALHPRVSRNNPDTYSEASYAAFSVQVTPVPEPASFATLGLGALAVIGRKRRPGRR